MEGGAAARGLDQALSQWRHRERHRLAFEAPTDRVLRAALEVTWRELPIVRFLMAVRARRRLSLPFDDAMLTTITSGPFAYLGRAADEIVVGVIIPYGEGKPPLAETPTGERFRDFGESGYAKIAFDLRYADGVLTSETRICPLGAAATRAFRRYWWVIRPFSGVTRHVMLRAIRRRALAST